ncbi:MAG: Pigment production hydroxylase [Aeromicrobium sp.]|nr:Pigment production hydroxylase [Aeromicrobium sp.]
MSSDANYAPIQAALRKYGPILSSESAASVRNGGLTETALHAFVEGGFAKLDLPTELGGFGDFSYVDWARQVEELSWYDAGSGWILHAVGGFTGLFAAMLPEEGAVELWGDGRSAVLGGMAAPRGRATLTDGGYTVEGDFQFASGSDVMTHFVGGCFVFDGDKQVMLDDGSPEFVCVVVPRDQVKTKGNWDVIGLQATASIDYRIDPTFVPQKFAINMNPWPVEVLRGAPRHRVGLAVHGVTGQPPVSLGAARRALEEIAALARQRKRRDGPYATIADQPLFQHDIAMLDAELSAARLAYFAFVESVDTYATEESGPIPTHWGDRASQVSRHALDVALKCVNFAYYWSGTAGLRSGSILGQLFLDVNAMNLHLVMDRNAVIQGAPTVLADLEDGLLLLDA